MSDISLDDIDELCGLTPLGKGATNTIFGMDKEQRGAAITGPKVAKQYVFFTRPQLNLRDFNLPNNRDLQPLMNSREKSMQRVIRNTLDPLLPYKLDLPSEGYDGDLYGTIVTCPLVDSKMPFIPMLGNTLQSFDGFVDLSLGKLESGPDKHRGVMSNIADVHTQNQPISFSATFDAMNGDVNRHLLYIWYVWQSLLYQGLVSSYPRYEMGNIKDFNTKVYVFNIAEDGETIISQAASGPAYITNVNYASRFNHKKNPTYGEDNKSFSVEFEAFGQEVDKIVTLHDFNLVVGYFHPGLRSKHTIREEMHILKGDEFHHMSHRAYPIVDIKQNKLKWLVDKEYYSWKMGQLKESKII